MGAVFSMGCILKKLFSSLSAFERCLWLVCMNTIFISSLCFWDGDVISLAASLVGVTALIFLAKGNWVGQVLTVIFALLYAIISYQNQYYGEMITYLFMTAPTAAIDYDISRNILYRCVLFHSEISRQRFLAAEHPLNCHQLLRRLSDVRPFSLLCYCILRK